MTRLSDTNPVMVAYKVATMAGFYLLSRAAVRSYHDRFASGGRQSAGQVFMYGTFAVHFLTFWLWSLLLAIVDLAHWPRFLYKHKIQATTHVGVAGYGKCIAVVLFNQTCLSLPINWVMGSMYVDRGMSVDPNSMPSIPRVARDLFICIVVEEILFYYSHRLLHMPSIYKYIHKVHHAFPAPIAPASEYAHPIEFVFGNVFPVLLGPYLARAHVQVLWLWMMLAISATCNGHSGYLMPFSPFHDARNHDIHHSSFTGNFGATGFLDWVHGTSKDYTSNPAADDAKSAGAGNTKAHST